MSHIDTLIFIIQQSALLQVEVLKERDAQLELKKLKEQAFKGQDDQWLQLAQQQHEQAILDDQKEAIERIHGVKETAEFQKRQYVKYYL